MVKSSRQSALERIKQPIRSSAGFVTVELAIAIATLALAVSTIVAGLSLYLSQLNLVDTAHTAARMAARGEVMRIPTGVRMQQSFVDGVLYVNVARDISFLSKSMQLQATASVVVE